MLKLFRMKSSNSILNMTSASRVVGDSINFKGAGFSEAIIARGGNEK